MSTEFLADAAETLIAAMREAGIGPEIAGPVMQQWLDTVVKNWGGSRPYIGSGSEAMRERSARDRAILRDYQAGERVALLARRYRISRQRVHQILTSALP